MTDEKYKSMVKTTLSKPKSTKEMMEKELQRQREKYAEKKLLLQEWLGQTLKKLNI